jgi:hypothetical protein
MLLSIFHSSPIFCQTKTYLALIAFCGAAAARGPAFCRPTFRLSVPTVRTALSPSGLTLMDSKDMPWIMRFRSQND